ncbi:MAG: hypothetical protein ACQEXQ_23840 [Bacillota bacterium]
MKKKLIFLAIAIIILVLSTYIALILYPKNIQLNAQGIKYRLGEENIGSEKLININIKGKLYMSITGNKNFKGTIDIEGEDIPVPENQRELEINFYKENNGVIVYSYIENGNPKLYQYGSIFTNSDFSKVTMLVTDKVNIDGNEGGVWKVENGQMISVPAKNRAESISLSNELMNEYLKGYKLK